MSTSGFEPDQHHTDPIHPVAPTPGPALHRQPIPLRHKVGIATAGALLLGSGVVGGLALGTHQSSPTTSAASGQSSTITFGNGQSTGGFSGGQFQAPQFDLSGGSGTSGTSYTPETYGDATAAQSVGLVEIKSTLTNGTAAGTGIILTSDGTIVTNHHVVAGATSVKVTDVSTGKTYTATYVGGNATTDVAVLKLADASGLTPVTLASDAAATGDSVTAVGDAGGDGGSLTASPGTVSATEKNITVQNDDGTSSDLTGLIEIDAYVVPGDSGGVVRNSAGEVVGMNVAASTGSSNVTGYAIPIATVNQVVSQILAGDTSDGVKLGYSGFLGVGLSPTSTAPLVVQVEDGGAADKAGIVAGDTITKIDGTRVTTSDQLRAVLADRDPGETVTLSWTTADGATHSGSATLGQAPIS